MQSPYHQKLYNENGPQQKQYHAREHLLQGLQVKILATSRERLNLRGEWTYDLHGLSVPSEEMIGESGRAIWSGMLTRSGIEIPVDVHFLGDESGCEYLFRPDPSRTVSPGRLGPAPEGVVSEVQILARSGRGHTRRASDRPYRRLHAAS